MFAFYISDAFYNFEDVYVSTFNLLFSCKNIVKFILGLICLANSDITVSRSSDFLQFIHCRILYFTSCIAIEIFNFFMIIFIFEHSLPCS